MTPTASASSGSWSEEEVIAVARAFIQSRYGQEPWTTLVTEAIPDMRAALQTLSPQGSWQPISTAPRDGRYIDLWVAHPKRPVSEGFRIPEVAWMTNEGVEGWWYEDGDEACQPYPFGRVPTHWMRLPNPPLGPEEE